MAALEFVAETKVVGGQTVVFVPRENPAARGAGLWVNDADPEEAVRKFGRVMDKARHRGLVPADATWRLRDAT